MLDEERVVTDEAGQSQDAAPLTVEVKPETVDAGAEMLLTALVSDDWDLAGEEVLFLDHEGNEVARGTIETDDEGKQRCGPVAVRAPMEPGEYGWQTVLPPTEDDDEPIDAGFRVVVAAHAISVVVWDVPPAIEKGTAFQARIGIRCSSDCSSPGWAFVVKDHEGREVARGTVGDKPWEGTRALHYADVELTAPPGVGLFNWTVTAIPPEHGLPHMAGEVALQLHTVPAPQYAVTVSAFDAETGAPAGRVKVVAHPYRATTDANGVATLRLPGGVHTIFVSGKQYFPFRTTEEVKADLSIRAELHVDREFGVADAWS